MSEQKDLNKISKQLQEASYSRAAADLEMLCAAFPDEIDILNVSSTSHLPFVHQTAVDTCHESDERCYEEFFVSWGATIPCWFPLVFVLTLADNSNDDHRQAFVKITMEFPMGYPIDQALQIVSYRGGNIVPKPIIESVVSAMQNTARCAFENGEECGLSCCSAAIETWRNWLENVSAKRNKDNIVQSIKTYISFDDIKWISAEKTLVDRKSVFQAHVCPVYSEDMVRRALQALIEGSNKIQRATHNMYAYRFSEKMPNGTTVFRHDNDDDGEDAAGSRLAHLLEIRGEDGVLIVVSRWYGGIPLGPKRFAHINNVARELLEDWHRAGTL